LVSYFVAGVALLVFEKQTWAEGLLMVELLALPVRLGLIEPGFVLGIEPVIEPELVLGLVLVLLEPELVEFELGVSRIELVVVAEEEEVAQVSGVGGVAVVAVAVAYSLS